MCGGTGAVISSGARTRINVNVNTPAMAAKLARLSKSPTPRPSLSSPTQGRFAEQLLVCRRARRCRAFRPRRKVTKNFTFEFDQDQPKRSSKGLSGIIESTLIRSGMANRTVGKLYIFVATGAPNWLIIGRKAHFRFGTEIAPVALR